MTSPYFTPAHSRFRAHVRALIAETVLPHADDWERDRQLPRHLWRSLGDAGMLGLYHPRAYGGAERDLFYSIVFLEELGRSGYSGFRAAVSVHSYMATHYLARAGSSTLKADYLAPAIAGERVAALAITEPEAGSDLSQLKTIAAYNGGSYSITGSKTFITNGTTADFAVVVAKTKPSAVGMAGLSLLLVELDQPGVTRTPIATIGWHSGDIADLHFQGVQVSADHLVGHSETAFMQLMYGLQLERLVAAALALGGMDRCLELIRLHLCQRQVFGETLMRYQALRHRVADLVTEVEATRHLIHHAAWKYQNGALPIAECTMAKLKATELASRVTTECLHMYGSKGYIGDAAMARFFRDAPAGTLAGGASEVMRDIIAQLALDEGWTAATAPDHSDAD